jgi:hypothetical protein
MNVGPDHHEPLDAEERALAERLARIGPFDGPSPALDAKILKAAHAAAGRRAPSKQRRWLAFMGVPPALVTGVGVAAAAVLALGLAWQLRPTPAMLPAMEEDGSASGEEVFVMAEPTPEPRAAIVNPPPVPVETPARVAAPAQARAPADAAAKTTESAAQMADMAAAVAADAAAGTVSAESAAPATPPVDELRERSSAAPAAAEAVQEPGFVPTPPAQPPAAPPAPQTAAKRRATYTNSARATATRREAEEFRAAPATSALPSQDAATEAGQELDKVVVTGSRIKRTDLAVHDDTRLEPAEWLERIRARRDAGALDDARESLRLFRNEHPRVRIPDDLRTLLATDPGR